MAKGGAKRNFLGGPDLGRLVAEQDQDLVGYYVEPERYVNRAIDPTDPAVFFVGPKGVGKSAILQMVRLSRPSETPRIVNITPDDLAFSALANIEATTPILKDYGKNQWLFKSLWDYILSLEILRREYRTENNIEQFLKSFFRDFNETEARRLMGLSLSDTGTPQSLSSRILMLIHEVELSAEVGEAKVAGKASIDAKDVVRGGHLNFLGMINSVAKHVHENLKHPYYITIDDLDINWSDTPIQNAFIAALFLSLKNFSKPPNLKCVVSMRDQIYRSLPLQDRDKFHDWVCHVEWDALSVKQMISQRVHVRLNVPVTDVWGSVFPPAAFDRMWRYTYGRPRELIRLSNLSLLEGRRAGHQKVEEEDIARAINQFSDERIGDLASEYSFKFPALEIVLRKFVGWPKEFSYDKFVKDFVEFRALEVDCGDGQATRYTWAGGYAYNPGSLARIFLELGFFLIKANRNSQPRPYDFKNPQEITSDNWFAIHPTYWAGLGLVGV